jgi:hypothetical protein
MVVRLSALRTCLSGCGNNWVIDVETGFPPPADRLDASCPQMLKSARQDGCSKFIGNVSFEALSSASSAFKHATDSQILNVEVDSQHILWGDIADTSTENCVMSKIMGFWAINVWNHWLLVSRLKPLVNSNTTQYMCADMPLWLFHSTLLNTTENLSEKHEAEFQP